MINFLDDNKKDNFNDYDTYHPKRSFDEDREHQVNPTSEKIKSVKVGKVPNWRGSSSNRYCEFITSRLGNYTYCLYAWAYGLILFSLAWYSFDSSFSVLNLNTKWAPAFATSFALIIFVLHTLRVTGNWRGFVKDTTNPTMLAYMTIAPIIISSLGQTILFETTTTGNGYWYAGSTFFWLGFVLGIAVFGYWIYITFFYNTFKFEDLNAAWMLPFANLIFVTYNNPVLIAKFMPALMQGLWGVGALILPLLLVVIYRYLFYQKTPADLTHFPILGLPIALITVGYMNVFNTASASASSDIFIILMLGMSFLLLFMIYMYLAIHISKTYEHYSKTINIFFIPVAANLLFTSYVSNITRNSLTTNLDFLSKPIDYFTIIQLIIAFIFVLYTFVGNGYVAIYEASKRPVTFKKMKYIHTYFVPEK